MRYIRAKTPSPAPTAQQSLDDFKDKFYKVVGASLGIAIAVLAAPAEIAVVAFAAAVYTGVCVGGTGFSIAGSSCDIRACSDLYDYHLLTR